METEAQAPITETQQNAASIQMLECAAVPVIVRDKATEQAIQTRLQRLSEATSRFSETAVAGAVAKRAGR